MEYLHIITGVTLIASGILVKKYPNLIAGYNTLSERRKKDIDIERLSSWIRNGIVLTGVLTIVAFYLLNYSGFDRLAKPSVLFTVIGGTFLTIIVARRFDKGRKS